MMAKEPVPSDCYVHLNDAALHDLFGPANQIQIMVDLILQQHPEELSDEVRSLLDFVMGASNRLACMMSGLRSFTRMVGRREPFHRFDANATLEDAVTAIQPALAESGAVITHDPLPESWGDPGQIGCVFVSLLGNAIKFRRECRPEIHVSVVERDRDWLFSVSDNGIGIEPTQAGHIFEVFQRVNRDQYPGAGIGLAVAQAVIERHRGRIWVESEPGRGATFFFALPRAPAVEENLAATGPEG
jgi:two-component system, sensor histidine kinase and response regulator